MKYLMIDNRMREEEKSLLKSFGYELIEIPRSNQTYPEISSHVDIFACKIEDTLVIEKSQYQSIKNQIRDSTTKIVERRKFYWKSISRRCEIQCLSD